MGKVSDDLYPFWRDVAVQFCSVGYNELILTGALGTGKTWASLVIFLRKLYELSCYNSIPKYLDLGAASIVLFFYLSTSQSQARLTGFGKLIRMIDSIPYYLDRFPRNYDKDTSLEFKDKELIVGCGSDIGHFRGGDLFGLVFDEGNFRRGSQDTKFQKARGS